MTLILSVIETIGISVLMPFISVASNPLLLEGGRYKIIFDLFNFKSKDYFILIFGIAIVVFYFFRAGYNVFYTYIQNKFSLGTYRHLANELYRKFLSMPYTQFIQKNSAEMHYVFSEANNVCALLQSVMQICADIITVLMLYSFIVIVHWRMTLILTVILLLLVLFILKIIIKTSKKQGVKLSEGQREIDRIFNENFGNYKFIRLKGIEKYNYRQFDKATVKISKSSIISNTLGSMPRNLLESVGFSLLIITVLFILFRSGSAESVIPIIAMYALALYRILPSINKMLNNVNQISFLYRSLDFIYNNYIQKTINEDSEPIQFEKTIRLKNISFQYTQEHPVLNNISFTITKGDKIAITGISGGGKSTLIDLLIGILPPQEGSLFIDDTAVTEKNIRSWRAKIGYIPQNIYLFDSSVAENVVFGSTYNEERLIKVLNMANIWDFLKQKDGLNTRVGEGGVQLSGGQKQRIGIARALYDDPDLLVLDEATSALDNDTETKIMDEIYDVSRNKTLIIVAHRLSTVEKCQKRLVIGNGTIA
jgi:ATP-binding cassette subfamily B protein/ATP-binding cassette subfamily C protein